LTADYGAAWSTILDVNVVALANVLAVTRAQPRLGTIVVVLSLASHQPSTTPGNIMYSAAKTAARTLLDQYRTDLRSEGNLRRLCAISPGYVRNTGFADSFFEFAPERSVELYEGQPSMEPEQVASAVEFAVLAPPEVEVSEIIMRPIVVNSRE
jgi:NADP-dependent 3-hydroxy acid dehydrogenase YdfG